MRKTSRLGEAALLFLSFLVGLVSLEGIVRAGLLIARPVSPKGGYAPIRGKRSRAPLNHAGYRDVEHEIPKPAGIHRIAFVGDSFTYGVGVLFDDTYPRRIARDLTHARREVFEPVVLAVPGEDTRQEADSVEREALLYEPDLVVLGYVLNDAEPADAAERRRADDWVARENARSHPPLWRRSALFSLVADRIRATRETRDRVANYLALYRPGAKGLQGMSTALETIGRLCREKNVPLLVAIFPLFANSFDDDYPFKPVHQTMASLCAEKKLECVDLLPAYRGLDWRLLVVEGERDEHPNELAHRLAADALQGPISRLLDRRNQGLLVPARP